MAIRETQRSRGRIMQIVDSSSNFVHRHGSAAASYTALYIKKAKVFSVFYFGKVKENLVESICRSLVVTGMLLFVFSGCVTVKNQTAILRHWVSDMYFGVCLGPMAILAGALGLASSRAKHRCFVASFFILSMVTTVFSLMCLSFFVIALLFFAIDGQHLWLICDRKRNPYYMLALKRANMHVHDTSRAFDMDWCFGRAKGEEEFFVWMYSLLCFFTLVTAILGASGARQVLKGTLSREVDLDYVATEPFFITQDNERDPPFAERQQVKEDAENIPIFLSGY